MKHICINKVEDRCYTIGKVYDYTPPYREEPEGCWISDDTGLLNYFSKIKEDALWYRYYYDYFEDLTSYIRGNKINTLIDG